MLSLTKFIRADDGKTVEEDIMVSYDILRNAISMELIDNYVMIQIPDGKFQLYSLIEDRKGTVKLFLCHPSRVKNLGYLFRSGAVLKRFFSFLFFRMERSDGEKYQNFGGAERSWSDHSAPLQFHSIAAQILNPASKCTLKLSLTKRGRPYSNCSKIMGFEKRAA